MYKYRVMIHLSALPDMVFELDAENDQDAQNKAMSGLLTAAIIDVQCLGEITQPFGDEHLNNGKDDDKQ